MTRCEIARVVWGAILTSLLVGSGTAAAQQLEPRAYSPSPVGANFAGIGYLYSTGGAVTDPSVPITNIHARVYNAVPYYGRTFGLFGRQASVTLTTPYAWATVSGDVQEVNRTVDRTGWADPQIRFSVNLIGNPALTPEEFRRHTQVTTLGTSLIVVAPYGEYDSSKLINLGTNRWAFKPELGLSHPHGNWGFEFYAGVWLFTDNNDFFGGQLRKQDPLASLQTHVVYTIRPRLWAALDFTYYSGGSTTVDGLAQDDRQNNSRGGITLSVPLADSQSVKLTWARGVSTRVGSNFDTMGVVWQLLWF
jgi:hypothetical protein